MLYSLKYLSLIFDQHDWFSTSADLLFNDDINELLDNLSEQGLNLSLDRDLAQSLHTQWVKDIIQGN